MQQLPIVGKQQQPFGLLVQAANGLQVPVPHLLRQKLHDSLLFCILRGSDIAHGLVHHHHPARIAAHGASVQLHRVRCRVDFSAGVFLGLSVHGHPPGFQQLLYLAAGSRAAVTQKFVQTFHILSPFYPLGKSHTLH